MFDSVGAYKEVFEHGFLSSWAEGHDFGLFKVNLETPVLAELVEHRYVMLQTKGV